ncbi:hypothetical protein [Streptomyces sp. NBC_00525]|uniref:hypothetical protein n=1 Tax=Streptomyces sp. NBC_00525 TaxID=2903660 RepID=UPI002E80791E|nr:hypothetical protein [Streptomyces sp. NBC_00525]WUC94995.1 hypothetical protein OG710_16030 [Streptomyces sp. NBC_00525]
MAITDDLRKTLTDPTPLYFAAGTADLAVNQARKVPALLEQLRAEAPERIEAVRNTDPKAVQEKVAGQAREAQATLQAKVAEVIDALDTDPKKLGEMAQDLALRGVGVAAEYAVRARETYEKVAEHGERTVRTWRGETADEIVEIAVVVEPREEAAPADAEAAPAEKPATAAKPAGTATTGKPAAAKPAAAKPKTAARKAPARKPAAKKATPPAGE